MSKPLSMKQLFGQGASRLPTLHRQQDTRLAGLRRQTSRREEIINRNRKLDTPGADGDKSKEGEHLQKAVTKEEKKEEIKRRLELFKVERMKKRIEDARNRRKPFVVGIAKPLTPVRPLPATPKWPKITLRVILPASGPSSRIPVAGSKRPIGDAASKKQVIGKQCGPTNAATRQSSGKKSMKTDPPTLEETFDVDDQQKEYGVDSEYFDKMRDENRNDISTSIRHPDNFSELDTSSAFHPGATSSPEIEPHPTWFRDIDPTFMFKTAAVDEARQVPSYDAAQKEVEAEDDTIQTEIWKLSLKQVSCGDIDQIQCNEQQDQLAPELAADNDDLSNRAEDGTSTKPTVPVSPESPRRQVSLSLANGGGSDLAIVESDVKHSNQDFGSSFNGDDNNVRPVCAERQCALATESTADPDGFSNDVSKKEVSAAMPPKSSRRSIITMEVTDYTETEPAANNVRRSARSTRFTGSFREQLSGTPRGRRSSGNKKVANNSDMKTLMDLLRDEDGNLQSGIMEVPMPEFDVVNSVSSSISDLSNTLDNLDLSPSSVMHSRRAVVSNVTLTSAETALTDDDDDDDFVTARLSASGATSCNNTTWTLDGSDVSPLVEAPEVMFDAPPTTPGSILRKDRGASTQKKTVRFCNKIIGSPIYYEDDESAAPATPASDIVGAFAPRQSVMPKATADDDMIKLSP